MNKKLSRLRQLHLVHVDIKPENILYSPGWRKIVLVDFGLATLADEPKYLFVRCGTPGYVAP